MDKVLTSDQEKAKNLIAEWFLNTDDRMFVLSGYAGTGKTFLIDYVVREVLHLEPGTEAVFVTPTGKAATVLIRAGTVAGTVHSLIYRRDEDDFDVDENGEIVGNGRLTFVKRDKIDEKIRLIVIDEASMIAEDVLRDLLSFGVKCLFSGDGAQLPPVGGSCGLLEHPDYTLTEIVRQAADNPIIRIATMAREGKAIPYGNYGDTVSVIGRNRLSPAQRRRIFLKADQIICGRNRTRAALNAEIRGYKGIPAEALLPVEGEKLICTLNDWEISSRQRHHRQGGRRKGKCRLSRHDDLYGGFRGRRGARPLRHGHLSYGQVCARLRRQGGHARGRERRARRRLRAPPPSESRLRRTHLPF